MKKGIDVSKWNGSNDFNRAKRDGIDFVIIRASWGGDYSSFKTGGLDPYWNENYSKAKAVGLGVGAYHYLYAQNVEQAKREAIRFVSQLKGKQFDYPVYLDIEDPTLLKLSTKLKTDMSIAFLDILENNGFYAGIYANLNWFRNHLDLNRLKNYDKWIAHYVKPPIDPNKYKDTQYQIWQYGSEGNYVDGITNNGSGIKYCDVNYSYIDNYPQIIINAGLNGYIKPTVDVTPIAPVTPINTDKKVLVTYNNEIDQSLAEMMANEMGYETQSLKNKINRNEYYKIIHVGGGENGGADVVLVGEDRRGTREKVVEFMKNGGIK